MSLRALAEELGVTTHHVDGLGQAQVASDEALLAILRALGIDIDNPEQAASILEQRSQSARDAARVMPPCVAICADADDSHLLVHGGPDAYFRATLCLEDGSERCSEGRLQTLQGQDGAWRFPLGALPAGYHRLQLALTTAVSTKKTKAKRDDTPGQLAHESSCVILSAPERAYGAPDGRREWGVFAPVHALRAHDTQGIGNLRMLAELMRWAGSLGASFVSTLPLLAADYQITRETSPYSPVSRLFWNELYLDLQPVIADYADDRHRDEIERELAERCAGLDELAFLDYFASSSCKAHVLAQLAPRAWERDEAALRSFVAEQPELHLYAQFRATMMTTGKTWPEWQEEQRAGRLRESDYRQEDYRYVVFVQWLAHQQLSVLTELPSKLYLDLSVGVSGSSFDVWRYQEDFVKGVDVGAPPDGLFEAGQNWALPPVHPQRSRENGHAYFAACVRTHMRYAGILRIDHVMGLHRLYWVPRSLGATQGVYVRYPADELYAILKIESHRQKCALVGEDLGTVPESVRPAMEAAGMHRLYVGQFSTEWREWENRLALAEPPQNAVASLDTHDTATFAGWFDTTDLQVDAKELMRSWTEQLASSSVAAVLVTLEDLWLEREPQNRPGTTAEVPNWRHRMAMPLADMARDADINGWLAYISDLRRS